MTLRDVAAAADTGLADLYRLYPDKMALVAGVMARIDAAVLAGTPRQVDPEETARDRLFDVMMRRYDALKPHREAVRSIVRRHGAIRCWRWRWRRRCGARWRRCWRLPAFPARVLSGAVRQNGLLAIYAAVSRVFDSDNSADLSKTMAALDGRLKTAERWAQTFEKYKVSRRGTVSEPRSE